MKLKKSRAGLPHIKTPFIMYGLIVVLLFSLILASALGEVNIPFIQTIRIILKNWGLLGEIEFPSNWEAIIFHVRLPRVITAAIVGAGLAASGTVMQGMFRNPMADPGILGVSSGASLGAVIAIALGFASKSIFLLQLFASFGALLASFCIYLLASKKGKTPLVNLILSGLAVSMFLNSVNTIILTYIHGNQVKQFLFWTAGSLNATMWEDVRISAGPVIIGIIVLFYFSRDMNVLLMGEDEAQSVGMNTSRTRKILLLVSSIITATAVCVSGTISFVGLLVPHITRLVVGPDHRKLFPCSILGGSIFLVICDLIGRTVVSREIGVGVVTSLLGAPYFLFLLNKARKEGDIF
ncbi:MAG TPA: iron chelate uptake ABC transporter family permease subunit [Clostridiaceae bacterium]|nr:iron chelate uptake ABC transporter family permease subunit [Clostridiaceae bacterium]